MKVKYLGKTIIPMFMATGLLPQFTNGKVYEVLEATDPIYYVVLDDCGKKQLMKKDECKLLEGENNEI